MGKYVIRATLGNPDGPIYEHHTISFPIEYEDYWVRKVPKEPDFPFMRKKVCLASGLNAAFMVDTSMKVQKRTFR